MNTDFKEFIQSHDIDAVVAIQAVRYALSEITNDLPASRMRSQLVERLGPVELERNIGLLAGSSEFMELVALTYLNELWSEPQQRELVFRAVDGAKSKLVAPDPVTAILLMYALYAMTTGGKKKERQTIKRKPDGSIEVEISTEYFSFSDPLKAVYKALLGAGSSHGMLSDGTGPDESDSEREED